MCAPLVSFIFHSERRTNPVGYIAQCYEKYYVYLRVPRRTVIGITTLSMAHDHQHLVQLLGI